MEVVATSDIGRRSGVAVATLFVLQSGSEPLDTPSNIRPEQTTDTTPRIAWDAVPDATGYWVTLTDGKGNNVASATVDGPYYQVTTVLANGTYTVEIDYLLTAEESGAGAPVLATQRIQNLKLYWGESHTWYWYGPSADIDLAPVPPPVEEDPPIEAEE